MYLVLEVGGPGVCGQHLRVHAYQLLAHLFDLLVFLLELFPHHYPAQPSCTSIAY